MANSMAYGAGDGRKRAWEKDQRNALAEFIVL